MTVDAVGDDVPAVDVPDDGLRIVPPPRRPHDHLAAPV